jgi:hypothetical protein
VKYPPWILIGLKVFERKGLGLDLVLEKSRLKSGIEFCLKTQKPGAWPGFLTFNLKPSVKFFRWKTGVKTAAGWD